MSRFYFVSLMFWLLSFGALAQVELSSDDFRQVAEGHDTEKLELTPDLVELTVEFDPRQYGYRARNHRMQLAVDFDGLVQGRVTLAYLYNFNGWLSLMVPASFENSQMSLGKQLGYVGGDRGLASSWAAGGGVGVRLRLSEWINKGSLFSEASFQALYISQTPKIEAIVGVRTGLKLQPAIGVGWQQVYDSGLVFVVKLAGVWEVNVPTGQPLVWLGGFSLSPSLGLGYAW